MEFPQASGFDSGYAHALANREQEYIVDGNFIHTYLGRYYPIDKCSDVVKQYAIGYHEGYELGYKEKSRRFRP